MTMKGGHEWWKYVYDEHYDCIICPEYQPLPYRTTNRDGYREYCSDSKNCVKTVLRHIWKDYEELADIPWNTRNFTQSVKKPLSGSLLMRRRSMVCVIRFTEVWPKFPNG